MRFLKSTVGRKVVMAVTGQLMILFIILHVSGNSTIYFSSLNTYAEKIHAIPALLWTFRLFMLSFVSFHIFFGIQLTLENSASKPQGYAVKEDRSATFASKNMIWTGLLIAAFLIYHLLHFTIQVTNSEISAGKNMDVFGRPDVFMMVVKSFRNFGISFLYLFAMAALGLHLLHGIHSSFQTWGLNNDATFPVIRRGGTIAAIVLFLGYISIPVVIFIGLLKP